MTILDWISRDVPLKQTASTNGGEWTGACPFCKTGTDRFHVWPNPVGGKARYWCRGCGEHGDWIDYVRKMENCGFKEACQRVGQIPTSTPLTCAAYKPQPPVQDDLSKGKITLSQIKDFHKEGRGKATSYYGQYNIHQEAVDKFLLGYIQYGSLTGYTLPRFYFGLPTGVKIRLADEKADPKYRALTSGLAGTGFGAGIFNTDHVSSPDGKIRGPYLPILFVTEDEKSAMMIDQLFPCAAYKFDTHWDSFLGTVFQNIGTVVWLAHNDKPDANGVLAGREQAIKFKEAVGRRGTTILMTPRHKDPADFARAEGLDTVKLWLETAIPGL